MLKIENVETFGWETALRGMRNPKNSWAKADTMYPHDGDWEFQIGPNDMKLAKTLADAGQVHGKFLRMIVVTLDVTAPLYWWKEFDTYNVGTVANSCSTMHKIHAKEFTEEDFSTEHLIGKGKDAFPWPEEKLGAEWIPDEDYAYDTCPAWIFNNLLSVLNACREKFIETGEKKYWWQLIQLLPSSYNQRRTIMLNYAVLKNIYEYRKDHKLDEWHVFCDMIRALPYANELIIGAKE